MKYSDFDYELIDCGEERRVERFGKTVVNRPCAQAYFARRIKNLDLDAFFMRKNDGNKWKMNENVPKNWQINIGEKIKAKLSFSENGQVGIFPEQFNNWKWIKEKVEKNPAKLKILNTFAYTGISTLFSSTENTEVCHVDGAKSAINSAKKNAELSGLSENKIRWICDDVLTFMEREIRRGNKYNAIIMDPPAFGRGGGKTWKISRDLPKLMELVEELLSENPLFVILTCHAPEYFSAEDFAEILEAIPQFKDKKAEELYLDIPSEKGNSLPSSFGARIC